MPLHNEGQNENGATRRRFCVLVERESPRRSAARVRHFGGLLFLHAIAAAVRRVERAVHKREKYLSNQRFKPKFPPKISGCAHFVYIEVINGYVRA